MITKLYTMHVAVYVRILSKLPAVFAEIRPPKPKKVKSKMARFRFGVRFGFGAYVKELIGFKAFYFSVQFWFSFGVYVKWP